MKRHKGLSRDTTEGSTQCLQNQEEEVEVPPIELERGEAEVEVPPIATEDPEDEMEMTLRPTDRAPMPALPDEEVPSSRESRPEVAEIPAESRDPNDSAELRATITQLAEAMPVDELPTADAFEHSAKQTRCMGFGIHPARSYRLIGYAAITVLFCLLAVGLGVGLRQRQTGGQTEDGITPTSTYSPSLAPTNAQAAPASSAPALELFLLEIPTSSVDQIYDPVTQTDQGSQFHGPLQLDDLHLPPPGGEMTPGKSGVFGRDA